MPKKFVQDVVPTGKRSIRNIPLPRSRVEVVDPIERKKKKAELEPVTESRPRKPTEKKKTGRSLNWGIWSIAVVVLLVLIYAGSFLFVSAKVVITPKEVHLPAAVTSTATFESVGSDLGYTIVSLSRAAEKQVPASGQEKVEKKASGKIVIYNNFSSASQTLIKNTRFETQSGLIFRIPEQISVPGVKTVNGVVTPGSISVTVFADAAGDKYNIGLSDFTIPGFKGDPKYAKITAKSDPHFPISGGVVGTVAKITATDAATAKTSIENQLKNDLREALTAQIPDTHILFKGAVTFNFEELPQGENSSPTTAVVREKGTVYGILFEKKALAHLLAGKLLGDDTKDIYIADFSGIDFTLENINSFDPTSTKTISFKLNGDVDFVWNVDESMLRASLSGQKKAQIKGILEKFESVDRASVTITPPWIFSLPKKTDKIGVLIKAAE